MLKSIVMGLAMVGAATAFAPSAVLPRGSLRQSTAGPSMQLYSAGKMQGKGVNIIPIFKRPDSLDGSMVGDQGFDPFGFSGWVNMKFCREAELKHGRVAMLAFVGIMVESAGITFPGVTKVFGASTNIFEIHNKAVEVGAMGQILLWVGVFEMLAGYPGMTQTMEGGARAPGDFGFDPLGLGKGDKLARKQLSEITNGRLAMLAVSVHPRSHVSRRVVCRAFERARERDTEREREARKQLSEITNGPAPMSRGVACRVGAT